MGSREAWRMEGAEDEDEGALATQVRAPDFGPFALTSEWTPSEPPPGGSIPPEGMLVIGPGTVFAGRYRIGHKIARGGMSTVWEALDERVDRLVALKLMSPHLADEPDYCARFEQEAKAAARLASAHVVALYDYGLHQGLPFMVLERLIGEDLFRRTRRVGALGVEETARVVEQAAAALHAAHRAGIVHRDVKPHNLFLAEQDGEEVVKLLDFGVAKHAGTAALRTRTGLIVGSPYFMSPEQVRGAREVDARSDLFSLGAVAYLCLTGKTPFGGAMPAVFLAILEGKPALASSLRAGLSPAVDRFFERALAVAPAARFATAVELAAALRDALGDPGRATARADREHAPVSERLPVRLPQRSRPRIVVEDDEAPRPSEYPTAISAVPSEILQRETASTVMPPPSPSPPAAAIPGGRISEPPISAPPISRAPTPRVVSMPVAAMPRAHPPERSIIVDEALLPAPVASAPAASTDAAIPGFSIAMRSYQPSVWAAPPRPRVVPAERLRRALPLVLAMMAGFIVAVAVIVIAWALLG